MTPTKTFSQLGLRPEVLKILDARSITTPTSIQDQAIPRILEGTDVIGIAQTGTGKTLAYVLPFLQHLLNQQVQQALVMVPTRELATQVTQVCDWFARSFNLKASVVIGGAGMHQQTQRLKQRPHIIIATPGRLLDHVRQRNVDLSKVNYLVLDEADRMFDMGFAPQMKQILKFLPSGEKRQTVLCSATMPDAIASLIRQYMHQPLRIEIAAPGLTIKEISQEVVVINHMHKKQALLTVLKTIQGSAIIFTRTKHLASRLVKDMRDAGYRAEELHSNRSQSQREKAVAAIQSKKSQFLVATDIAGRGIDIPHITIVINYDLPENPEDYVHRIGRTGRAGRSGKAISFVSSDQGQQLHRIQKLIQLQIPQISLETVPSAELTHSAPSSRSQGGRRFGGTRRFGGHRGRRR